MSNKFVVLGKQQISLHHSRNATSELPTSWALFHKNSSTSQREYEINVSNLYDVLIFAWINLQAILLRNNSNKSVIVFPGEFQTSLDACGGV
jgi:hypothetical protein